MIEQVDVTTAARLHFGLICGPPDAGWHYGGIGLMIDRPGWQIQVCRTDHPDDQIDASPATRERLIGLLHQLRDRYRLPTLRIETQRETGFHTGLGSGTQLTLAVATACRLLSGQPRPASVAELAAEVGRSRRSAVGTFGFDHGGFIIDRGRACPVDSRQTSPAVQKILFPADWRMVVVTPRDRAGLSGTSEEQFFGERSYLDKQTVDRLDELIEAGIQPAVADSNFDNFCDALQQYGDLVGEYYADQQGGIFSHPEIRRLVPALNEVGITGAVQSSWGPSIAIPAETHAAADRIIRQIAERSHDRQLDAVVAKAANYGATIRTPASDTQRSFG